MSLCAKRVDFDQVWAHLSVDIQRMFNGDDDGGTGSANDSAAASTKKSSVSAMALYNDVYDLCRSCC